MTDEEALVPEVEVIIAFDPYNRKREGGREKLPAPVGHSMVATGRAAYADPEHTPAAQVFPPEGFTPEPSHPESAR